MRPDAEDVLHSDPELYQRYLDNNCKREAHEDLRVTKVGLLLGATSLDEFPSSTSPSSGTCFAAT